MKSKKGGKSKGSKKRASSRKKKFSLEFNFGGSQQANQEPQSPAKASTSIPKEAKKKESKILQPAVAYGTKEDNQILKSIEPIKAQDVKENKKADPAIILLFLMFLVGVLVIILAFIFKDYFIYYIISGGLILIINFVFFILHKKTTKVNSPDLSISHVIKQEKPAENKVEDKKIEPIAAKNVQIEPVDIKKEKAKVINLIVTVFALVIILYLAITKGFISKIPIPKSFGLNELVIAVVVIAVLLILFNTRRRSKKRKELIKKATAAVISGKISASQVKIPMQLGGKIVIDGQEVKLKRYQTELDLLLEIINEKKSIAISEIQKIFSVPKDLAEEWGRILEEHGLIKLYYPALGDPLFRANTFVEVKKHKVKKS